MTFFEPAIKALKKVFSINAFGHGGGFTLVLGFRKGRHMGRKTRVLGFSVTPEVAQEYEQLAQFQRKSKSELFRQMIETYKAKLEEEFFRLQAKMARRARKKGVFTEKEVERIVFEDR